MSSPITKLPPVPMGSAPIFQWARRIHKCIEERTLLYFQGGSFDRKTNGFGLKIDEPFVSAGTSANIKLFRIAVIGVGSLSCNEVSIVNGVQSWDPNAIITVNMPYGITGNSVTITEGSGASSATIEMGLEPVYAVDNFIFAVEADDGGWWDLNIAARHYEPPWQQVVVCLRENNQDVKRYMWIRGSAPFGTVP